MSKKLFALLFVMLMLCGAALADGITVTDMHGREIALNQPATRIVALTPSDCEILCAIGCEDALVGRGKYCDYPESISALPVVQSGAETNIEEILALDPQVVLMSDMSQTEEQAKLLEQNGVKVVISDANDIAGVYTAIRMIGALMAKDDAAEALIGDMQADQMRTVAAVELLDGEEQEKIPSLVLRRLLPEETLWDVAKQYRTDEELLRTVNHLEEGETPDKMLLIPRVR